MKVPVDRAIFDNAVVAFFPEANVKYPGLEVYVGLFTNVPVLLCPLKSVHVVPVPGYDDTLVASKFSINPAEIIEEGAARVSLPLLFLLTKLRPPVPVVFKNDIGILHES